MKSFNEFLVEELSSRTQVRDDGRSTSSDNVDRDHQSKIVGWFSNKYNKAAGWALTTLSDYDAKWVKSHGHNPKSVFRSFSDNGNTSLVMINAKSGTYAFADNKHLTDTDELKFDRPVKYSKLFIDKGKEKAFGI